MADLYEGQGKYDRAETLNKEVLAACTAKLEADHPNTLRSKNNLASVYGHQGKYDEADTLQKEVLAAWTAKLGADHPNTLISKNNLADLYQGQGKYDRAEPLFKEALDGLTAKLGADHPHTLKTKNNLAVLYWRLGKLTRSVSLFEEILGARRKILGEDHPDTMNAAFNLAINYRDAGRFGDAAKLIDEWLPRSRAKLGLDHPATQLGVEAVVGLYDRAGTPEKAEPLVREVADLWKQKAGAESPRYAAQLAILGLNLLLQKKATDAEAVVRECLTIREKKAPEDWKTFNTQSMLGGALRLQNKYAEAEPLLVQGYDGMKQREAKIPGEGRPRLTEASERLVQLYDATGQKEKAAEWRQKLQAGKLADELWRDLLAGRKTEHRFIETKQQGSLTAEKAKHVHPLEMKAGSTYVLDLESKAFDTFLILEDSDGARLAENDDISAGNLNSRIIYTAPKTGTYRVIATAFTPGAAGPYVLRIRELVGKK